MLTKSIRCFLSGSIATDPLLSSIAFETSQRKICLLEEGLTSDRSPADCPQKQQPECGGLVASESGLIKEDRG
jgi:hypothetical protein